MKFFQSHLKESFQDTLLFVNRWIESPRRTGALLPSSKTLSRVIARAAFAEVKNDDEYILELGPGTGPCTQALLETGFPAQRLISIEMDPGFYALLVKKFPNVHFIQGDAAHLTQIMPPESRGKVAAVLSGIPMLNLPEIFRKKIIDESFAVMQEGGKFFQWSYSPLPSIKARDYQLKKKWISLVLRNSFPATVWSYSRYNSSNC